MSYITLSQSPANIDCVLYPASDNTIALTKYPATALNNASCVDDDQFSPNDDTDYVYGTSIAEIMDLYNMTPHTTQTGVINYIRVVTRAKSNLIPQAPTGSFKHRIVSGTGTNTSGNYRPLSTVYGRNDTVLNVDPATGTAWTWAAIDALKAGLIVSSPTINTYLQQILRPTANISTMFTANDHGINWDNVNDVSPDGWTLNWYYGLGPGYDIFSTGTGAGVGTIDNLSLFSVVRASWLTGYHWLGVRIGGVNYFTNVGTPSPQNTWCNFSRVMTVKPSNSTAWTWSDINSLQFGYGHTGTSTSQTEIDQTYAVVNYHTSMNPEIRCTQLYVIVNYTPSPSIVTLLAPSEARYSNQRNIQRFLFPDGTYCAADFGRRSKTLSLIGTEMTNAIQKMRQVQAMLDNMSPVTITGLLDTNQDVLWRLKNFNFDYDIGGDHFDWTADFESYDAVT